MQRTLRPGQKKKKRKKMKKDSDKKTGKIYIWKFIKGNIYNVE